MPIRHIGFPRLFVGAVWKVQRGEQFPRTTRLTMNAIIIAAIVLLLMAVGIYVYRTEKLRRRKQDETRNPWDKKRGS